MNSMLPFLGTGSQSNKEPILMGSYKENFSSDTTLKIIMLLDRHPPIMLGLAPP